MGSARASALRDGVTSVTYAAGGAGKPRIANSDGASALANTGNGGDGGASSVYVNHVDAKGGNGGSGIVILRYVSILSALEAWRQTHFDGNSLTNAAISGDDADPDHDGCSNVQEFWAGTDPTNSLSVLSFSASEFSAPSSEFVIRGQSASNRFYTLQAATDLMNGFNIILGSNIPAVYPVNVHTDNVSGVGCRFYRVKVE